MVFIIIFLNFTTFQIATATHSITTTRPNNTSWCLKILPFCMHFHADGKLSLALETSFHLVCARMQLKIHSLRCALHTDTHTRSTLLGMPARTARARGVLPCCPCRHTRNAFRGDSPVCGARKKAYPNWSHLRLPFAREREPSPCKPAKQRARNFPFYRRAPPRCAPARMQSVPPAVRAQGGPTVRHVLSRSFAGKCINGPPTRTDRWPRSRRARAGRHGTCSLRGLGIVPLAAAVLPSFFISFSVCIKPAKAGGGCH